MTICECTVAKHVCNGFIGPGLSGRIKSSCSGNQIGGGTVGCVVKVCVSGGSGGIRLVLRMPLRGRFMCPFAVAGLGLSYLRINFSDKLGHTNSFEEGRYFRIA